MSGFTQIPNEWVFDDPLWTSEKFTKPQAYIDLYKLAQYKPGIVNKRGNMIHLKPGQLAWSQIELSKRWKRSLNWVRSLLIYLKESGHIVLQISNVSSTITLLHWKEFGTTEGTTESTTDESQKNHRRYTNNIVHTKNKVNKRKK